MLHNKQCVIVSIIASRFGWVSILARLVYIWHRGTLKDCRNLSAYLQALDDALIMGLAASTYDTRLMVLLLLQLFSTMLHVSAKYL